MHFLRAAFVQEVHRLPQLGAPDDGVVHEQQLLALNQLRHGNLLHFRHQIAHLLICGSEGTGPGGGVLDEGTGEGLMGLVCVADGVGQTGVRHARHEVHVRHGAGFHFLAGHDLAVAVAHDLHVFALVVGVGVAVVRPQEGADLHFRAGGGQLSKAVRRHFHDLPGAKLVMVLIAQLVVGEGLEGYAQAVVIFPHQNGQPPQPIPGGDDGVGGQQQNGAGAVNDLLRVADAVDQAAPLVDEGGGQFGGVDLAGGHGHELMSRPGKGLGHQLFGVVDDAHGGDGEHPQVGAHQQRLRVGVGNAADTGVSAEFGHVVVKFRAEGGVFNAVDLPLEALLLIVEGKPCPAGAEVGVVVRAEENVVNAILMGNRPEETAHCFSSLSRSAPPEGRRLSQAPWPRRRRVWRPASRQAPRPPLPESGRTTKRHSRPRLRLRWRPEYRRAS